MKTCKSKSSSEDILPLNRKNAIDFAKSIYSKKDGKIQYTKLCEGAVRDPNYDDQGYPTGETLHCAIGEAYYRFVDTDTHLVTTDHAVATVLAVAVLKKNTVENQSKLRDALNSCVDANDAGYTDFEQRAKKVAETWKKNVVPLLKT